MARSSPWPSGPLRCALVCQLLLPLLPSSTLPFLWVCTLLLHLWCLCLLLQLRHFHVSLELLKVAPQMIPLLSTQILAVRSYSYTISCFIFLPSAHQHLKSNCVFNGLSFAYLCLARMLLEGRELAFSSLSTLCLEGSLVWSRYTKNLCTMSMLFLLSSDRRWNLQVFQDIGISFPMGCPLPVHFRIRCWMWDFEIEFLPWFFDQNVQFHSLLGGSCSFVGWSECLCPQPPQWPQGSPGQGGRKGGFLSTWEAGPGISFAVSNQCPGMNRGTTFPTELPPSNPLKSVHPCCKIGFYSFLVFSPVLHEICGPNLNPTALERSCSSKNYSLWGATHPSYPVLPNDTYWGHLLRWLSEEWQWTICSHPPEYYHCCLTFTCWGV